MREIEREGEREKERERGGANEGGRGKYASCKHAGGECSGAGNGHEKTPFDQLA
jgi:hypothetical protein